MQMIMTKGEKLPCHTLNEGPVLRLTTSIRIGLFGTLTFVIWDVLLGTEVG